jgi:hypothetical protein
VKIQFALFARYAEVEPQGGLLNVTGGGVDIFGVQRLPTEFPVRIALQLVFDESEAGTEHELSLIVRGPDLEPVGEPTTTPITPTLGDLHAEGWRGTFTIAGDVVLAPIAAGAHSLGIQIDGSEAFMIPFQVLLA